MIRKGQPPIVGDYQPIVNQQVIIIQQQVIVGDNHQFLYIVLVNQQWIVTCDWMTSTRGGVKLDRSSIELPRSENIQEREHFATRQSIYFGIVFTQHLLVEILEQYMMGRSLSSVVLIIYTWRIVHGAVVLPQGFNSYLASFNLSPLQGVSDEPLSLSKSVRWEYPTAYVYFNVFPEIRMCLNALYLSIVIKYLKEAFLKYLLVDFCWSISGYHFATIAGFQR